MLYIGTSAPFPLFAIVKSLSFLTLNNFLLFSKSSSSLMLFPVKNLNLCSLVSFPLRGESCFASEKPSTFFSTVSNPSIIVLSAGSSCVAKASCTSIQRRLFLYVRCCTSLSSFLISPSCSYNLFNVFVSLSERGSFSKSLTAVRYVKSPILARNSSVLLNGSNDNGSCPTSD